MRQHRKIVDASEQDVFTSWRKFMCWTQRAGATSKVKRRARRRERHQARNEIRRDQQEL